MTELEVLRAAKAHLENPKNWYKGGWHSARNHRRVCAAGACVLAQAGGDKAVFKTNFQATSNPALNFLHEAAEQITKGKFEGVGEYNDAPQTTHEQILAVFDKAIELAQKL